MSTEQDRARWQREADEIRRRAGSIEPTQKSDDGSTERYLQAAWAAEAAGAVRWDQHTADFVRVSTYSSSAGRRRDPVTEDGLLARFEKVRRSPRGWTARCPSHRDRSPSLSITRGHSAWLLYCHAACAFEDIVAAVGLEPADLFFGGDSA